MPPGGGRGPPAIEDDPGRGPAPQYERAENDSGWLPGTDPDAGRAARASRWTCAGRRTGRPRRGGGAGRALPAGFGAFDPAVTARGARPALRPDPLGRRAGLAPTLQAVADAFDAALTAAGYDIDYYDLTLVPAGRKRRRTESSRPVEGVIPSCESRVKSLDAVRLRRVPDVNSKGATA